MDPKYAVTSVFKFFDQIYILLLCQIYILLLCNGNLEIHVWIVHRRQLNFLFISMT